MRLNNHSQKRNTLKIGKIGFKIALKAANNKVRSRISKAGGKCRNLTRIETNDKGKKNIIGLEE